MAHENKEYSYYQIARFSTIVEELRTYVIMSYQLQGFLLVTAFKLLIIVSLSHQGVLCRDCEVEVAFPWQRYTYSQPGSSVIVNCTTESSDINAAWLIQLPGRENFNQFALPASRKALNDQGFYELGLDTVIQLQINNTLGKNGTVIRCIDAFSSTTIAETILIVDELNPMSVLATDVHLQTVEITWPPLIELPPPLIVEDINETYTLSATSANIQPQIVELHERSYVFTAPEGTPPCEVYNFSVLATYRDIAGTTYTGDGCSVATPVLQRMLPSLPDIRNLESSLYLVLMKNATGQVTLKVSFSIPQYCPSYLVTSKTLDIIEGPVSDSLVIIPERNSITVHNLFGNNVYKFNIVVFNRVANASTNVRKIYTTDVQQVDAKQTKNDIQVECNFISGSDAVGCMVVLVGDTVNTTVNVTRCGTSSCSVMTLHSQSLSCYFEVFAFDIESDGSVGTLAISGELKDEQISKISCAQNFSSGAIHFVPELHVPSTVIATAILQIAIIL